MNKKTTIIILVVLLLVLLAAVGYLTLVNKPASNQQATNSQNPPPSPSTNSLPASCVDMPEGVPVITSLSTYNGPVGTQVDITGCNFAGFEGDKNAWIENSSGVKGIMYGMTGSTSNLVKVILSTPLCQVDTSYSGDPCPAQLTLVPGVYKIYTNPWGTPSNQAIFTIY